MEIWLKRIALGIIIILALATIGFVWWGNTPLQAMPEAIAALESDNDVLIINKKWMVFSPINTSTKTGVIIYPGGHVDPRAYAPLAKEIAAAGFLVILSPMPLNLAVFDMNLAGEIMEASPDIERWLIGGHSLGGAMAAEYVAANPYKIDGLFLWASYSAESTDLSHIPDLKVLSIYGTEDGGVEEIRVSGNRLPTKTVWVEMEGANHAQFGWYGIQPGDGVATISREEQQAWILKETIAFIEGKGK
ncbi:MAG: alpha/beta hydrolase [Chloroflexi bacterium]|nr:alpha/beta hydrolase [Chloroflexota bacterium]